MLVSTDPDGAERITRSMTDGFWKAVALLHMASELQLCGNCLTKVEGKDLGVMAAQGLRSSLPGERLTIPGRYCMP